MIYLKNIEPESLWQHFEKICQIPRPSKKEGKILNHLIEFAKKNKLEYKQDKIGNLLIKKKATPGYESLKTVILQSHVDMVGEKENKIKHDFEKDPIIPKIKQGWVTAGQTTLGADDGIGIAAQLVILESDKIEHGALECLFTIDEESGMTGASNLEPGFFEATILLNLDSEDEGDLFIGCAGGIDTIGRFKINLKPVKPKTKAYHVMVSGLKGGHSGDEIHKSAGNALKILNRLLWNAIREFDISISRFEGGNLRNAIPRDAEAIIVVRIDQALNLESFFQVYSGIIKKELATTEPGMSLFMREMAPPATVIGKKLQRRLTNAIYACPHGVMAWSQELEGLVETSTNLASIKFENSQEIVITTNQRSSIDSSKKDISDRIESVFRLARAGKVEHTSGYPGWKPNPDSEIVKITTSAYRSLFRKTPVVRAIHAGLECGLFLEKYPSLDMISFGPTIKGAHTPKERINIRSTQKFWKLLQEVLKRIPVR